MDLGTLIGSVIGALGFAATVAGAFVAYGRLNGKVEASATEINDLKEETKSLRREIDEAKRSANSAGGLAQAVEHLAEKFTGEIKHLVQVMDINNQHLQSQLSEIKSEVLSVRSNQPMPRAPRGRGG